MFRLLDNFNLPLGGAEGGNAHPELLKGMRSSTIWTSTADTQTLVYYYHTQHNRRVRMVDLKKIRFSPKNSGIIRFPLDKQKSQDYENVTPKQTRTRVLVGGSVPLLKVYDVSLPSPRIL